MRQHLKHYFIPHEENDYKPHILQSVSIGVMVVMILITFVATNLQSLVWMSSNWLVSAVLPAVVIDLTNGERTKDNLASLHRNPLLDEATTMKAEDMVKNQYFAHYSPAGVSPWFWFDKAGYNFVHAGENLAVHFTDSSDVVRAWMNSPGHRANILDNNYTEIGVGTAQGTFQGFPTVFVVQLFGTPALAEATTPTVTAAAPPPPATPVVTSQVLSESTSSGNTLAAATQPAETNTPSTAPPPTKTIPKAEPVVSSSTPVAGPATSTTTSTPGTAPGVDTSASSGAANDVVVMSDLATTSRPGIAAPISPDDTNAAGSSQKVSILARSATQPHVWLEFVYGALALFVVVSLLLSIVIEWRRQHPVQIAYGTGLLALMALLFFIHTILTAGAVIA